MPKRVNKEARQLKRDMAPISEMAAELVDVPRLAEVAEMKLVKIVFREVLKGTNAEGIKAELEHRGHHVGNTSIYKIMKVAKAQVIACGEKDMAVNYGWAQANLMDIHKQALNEGDNKMRLVTIRQLIELWGLNRPHEEVKETEITPEMIDEFEQKLLR